MKSTCAATTRLVRAFALATGMPLLATLPPPAVAGAASAPAVTVQANPLLSIDQNRATVVERIVATWGDALAASGAGLDKEHLQTLLLALRADHLFAASLAGSLDGLRNVIANALTANAPVAPALLHAKALGDAGDDLVYTPVTPCRLVETRGTFAAVYQGDGTPSHAAVPFATNEIRNYAELGGNAVCLAQLPAGLNPSAVQLQVFGIPVNSGASGDIEILPQGASFGSTATLIYLGGIPFTSASATAKVNLANNQIGVQVRGGGAHVAIDVVGYFKAPNGAVPSGSGTTNTIAKWTPNGTTLGDSAIVESGGMVGIGTSPPAYTLDMVGGNAQINMRNGSNNTTALISRYTNRLEISPVDALQISVGGIAVPHVWVGGNGNVGIGNTAPANHLQIGGTPGFSGNDFALGNGTKAMSFLQSNTASTWFSSANFSLMPNTGTGYVGIGTQTPASRLQVGSMGSTGYSGHDIAFGNGTQASGILQTGSVAQWYSTTDIALMPQGGGGHVGINVTVPVVPLNVADYVQVPSNYVYFKPGPGNVVVTGSCSVGCLGNVTIYASNNVMAAEFDAISDARIKDIVSVSNSAGDLDTINAIQVTDYTLKDKIRNGDKPFKKVIAQQVESVYPQVVSTHVDFIPNVYQAASSVARTTTGTLLHFDDGHHLSGAAKQVKLLASDDHTMQKVGIVAIPSANDVVVDLAQPNGDRVFVYGEEVDDFRTVDYEGLTALNISATQELSKRLARQQADTAALAIEKDAQLADLRQQLARHNTRMAELELDRQARMAEMEMLKQQVAQMIASQAQSPRLAVAGK